MYKFILLCLLLVGCGSEYNPSYELPPCKNLHSVWYHVGTNEPLDLTSMQLDQEHWGTLGLFDTGLGSEVYSWGMMIFSSNGDFIFCTDSTCDDVMMHGTWRSYCETIHIYDHTGDFRITLEEWYGW